MSTGSSLYSILTKSVMAISFSKRIPNAALYNSLQIKKSLRSDGQAQRSRCEQNTKMYWHDRQYDAMMDVRLRQGQVPWV
jgi:hypothetical protein